LAFGFAPFILGAVEGPAMARVGREIGKNGRYEELMSRSPVSWRGDPCALEPGEKIL